MVIPQQVKSDLFSSGCFYSLTYSSVNLGAMAGGCFADR